MPFSNIDKWFTIGSSVTALSTTSVMLTGQTIDLLVGSPRRGYDLTVRASAIYTAATNAGANPSTSLVTNTVIVDMADDSAFASTAQQDVMDKLILPFVLDRSSTGSVTTGARVTNRISTQHRYAKVRIITPTGPGLDTTMITTALEAILGDSTPA